LAEHSIFGWIDALAKSGLYIDDVHLSVRAWNL